MTKPTKNLKKRLKAPRELVEATKKGERFVSVQAPNTRAMHIRRFSKAIAAYACVAVVLIAGVAVLPMLFSGEPVPSTPAQSTTALLEQPDYVPLPEEQAAGYVRPDLIWANELNPQLKDNMIWAFEQSNKEQTVTDPFTMPAVGGEDAQYAVEFVISIGDSESSDVSYSVLKRIAAQIYEQLAEQGFTEVQYRPSETGSGYGFTTFYAVSRADLDALDTDAIMTKLSTASGDLRIWLCIAWQSCGIETEPKDTIVWSAHAAEGTTTVLRQFTLPAGGENTIYTVEFRYEPINGWENVAASSNKMKRNAGQMQDVIVKAGGELIGESSLTSSVYTMDRGELSAVDTDELLSLLAAVGDGIRIELRIAEQ